MWRSSWDASAQDFDQYLSLPKNQVKLSGCCGQTGSSCTTNCQIKQSIGCNAFSTLWKGCKRCYRNASLPFCVPIPSQCLMAELICCHRPIASWCEVSSFSAAVKLPLVNLTTPDCSHLKLWPFFLMASNCLLSLAKKSPKFHFPTASGIDYCIWWVLNLSRLNWEWC